MSRSRMDQKPAPDSFATSMCSRVRTLVVWARTARASHGQEVMPMTKASVKMLRLFKATLSRMTTMITGMHRKMLVTLDSRLSTSPPRKPATMPTVKPMTVAMVIGLTAWFWVARAVRAQSSSVREREHIDVARLSGAGFWSILGRDVLPYLLSYVVMAAVLQISSAILFESTLSLLGLGPGDATSLGTMLYWAIAWGSVRTGAWWAFVPPTLMLTLIVFGLLLLQSSLNEVFNPRLRRGRAARRRMVTQEQLPEAVGATGLLEAPVSGTEHA